MSRITQLIIGGKGRDDLVHMLRKKEKKMVFEFKGSTMTIEDVRDLPSNNRVSVVISQGEKLNRYVVAALLKGVEEGQNDYIFFVDSVVKFNSALSSRCQKIFITPKGVKTLENLWDDLDNKEKSVVDSVLGLDNIKRIDIYSDFLDYAKIFNGIAKAYSNKVLFDNVPNEVWAKIESVIFQPEFRSDRRALWFLLD